jgi:hypothetical protein
MCEFDGFGAAPQEEAMMDGLLCRASWPEGLAVIML